MAWYYLTDINYAIQSDTVPTYNNQVLTESQYDYAVANRTAKLSEILAESPSELTLEQVRRLKHGELYNYINTQRNNLATVLLSPLVQYRITPENKEYLDTTFKSTHPKIETGFSVLTDNIDIWHEGLLSANDRTTVTIADLLNLYAEYNNQENSLINYEREKNEEINEARDIASLNGMSFYEYDLL